jgi:hypothetical protein
MNIEQAKTGLKSFLNGKELTFSIKRFENSEWIAECNEIPAIATGGMGDDISNLDLMIREAILTAAGIDTEYANDILKFKGYRPKTAAFSFFKLNNIIKNEAEYVLS